MPGFPAQKLFPRFQDEFSLFRTEPHRRLASVTACVTAVTQGSAQGNEGAGNGVSLQISKPPPPHPPTPTPPQHL